MMNFPLRRTTAGLNVPADSQVVPCGERMGSFVARFQAPKGRSVAGAAKANEVARSNSTMKFLGFRTCMFFVSSLRGLVSLLRLELHGADDAFAFFDEDHLVRLDVLQGFHEAAGPANLEDLDVFGFADAEVNAQIILRKIAAAAADIVDLRMQTLLAGTMRYAFDACADAAAIGFRANGLDFDPIVGGARVAPQKLGKIVNGVDDDVEIAVVIKVAEGTAARGDRLGDSGAGVVG